MAKGQKPGHREIRKPKREKPASKPADPFANQTRLAANQTPSAPKAKREGRDVP